MLRKLLRKLLSTMLAAGVVLAMSSLALSSPVEAHGGGGGHGGHKVKMFDDCDPASFNAFIREQTGDPEAEICTGDGETTFGDFIAQLEATHKAADWEFDPSMLRVRAGRPVILENRGGELHTFTLVEKFGGGFVEELNALSGNEELADECVSHHEDGTVMRDERGALVPAPPTPPTPPGPPGPVNVFVFADSEDAYDTAGLTKGKYLFQCCLHPWMRVILTVR